MKPRAIVFDLWFTLITPEDFNQPYVSTAERIPALFDLDPEPFLPYWTERFAQREGTSRPIVECLEEYLSGLGRTMTEDERSAFDALWIYHDQALGSPRPRVLAALRQLASSGYRLGLLSNAHERETRGWETSPLAEVFDEACFSCHLGHVKPEPQAYAAILDRLQVQGADVAFVGDGASGELKGARDAGIRWTVWMRGFYDAWGLSEEKAHAHLENADAAIADLTDLPGVLGELSR